MSNNLEQIMPRIVARGLMTMRQKAIFPRLVNSEFSAEAAKRGDVIDVPLAQKVEVKDVVPSNEAPTPPDTKAQTAKIELKHWKRASFHLTDKEMDQIEAQDSFIPLQMAEAINALTLAVNQSVIDALQGGTASAGQFMKSAFPSASENVGTGPKGLEVVADARRQLNAAAAPKSGRSIVLSYDAEADFINAGNSIEALSNINSNYDTEGEIGRRLGFDFFSTDSVEKDGYVPAVAYSRQSHASNAKQIYVTKTSGTFSDNSKLRFEEQEDREHTVHYSAGNDSLHLVSLTATLGKAMDKGTYMASPDGVTAGLAFHRDAVALAMRPLASTGLVSGNGSQMMTITDPESGLSLRLEVSRQYKQTVWEFDLLWGVALVRPEYVIKIQGR